MSFLRTARKTTTVLLPVALALPAFADATIRPTPRPDVAVHADMPTAPIVPAGWRDRLVAANLASIHDDMPGAPAIVPFEVRAMGGDMPAAPALPSVTEVAVYLPAPVVLHDDLPVMDFIGPRQQAEIDVVKTVADAG